MKYISGLHALNIPCRLETSGDWHTLSLSWENIPLWNTKKSPFGTEGIEQHHSLMGKKGIFYIANHIRACLDLLLAGDFSNLQGIAAIISARIFMTQIFLPQFGNCAKQHTGQTSTDSWKRSIE